MKEQELVQVSTRRGLSIPRGGVGDRGEGDKRVSGHRPQRCCGIAASTRESTRGPPGCTVPHAQHWGDASVPLSRLRPPLFSPTSPHFPRRGVWRPPLLQPGSVRRWLAATRPAKTENPRAPSQPIFPVLKTPRPLSPLSILLAPSQTPCGGSSIVPSRRTQPLGYRRSPLLPRDVKQPHSTCSSSPPKSPAFHAPPRSLPNRETPFPLPCPLHLLGGSFPLRGGCREKPHGPSPCAHPEEQAPMGRQPRARCRGGVSLEAWHGPGAPSASPSPERLPEAAGHGGVPTGVPTL